MRRTHLPWLAFALILLLPAVASADDGTFASYQARGTVWLYLAAFGFGFLTSLTPCVYPMIPITLSIFGARGKDVPKKRAIALATMYVGGMGATYSILGITFALIGKAGDFGTQLANPWIVFPLVILFVALALSMFGAFDLNLPSSLQAKLNQVGGSGFGGAFAMGLVGGLIAAPCTGPFLAGLLASVTTTGNVALGASLLFTYAIGMGVLFWVLAAFALSLPKSGRWMEGVKSVGGIGLLFAAIYYLKPFLPLGIRHAASPAWWFLVVVIVVAIVGILLGAVHLSFHGPWGERGRKAIGVAFVLAGAVGAWMWWMTPKHRLPWVYGDEKAAFDRARAEGKGVMVDFSATWCNPCEELELTFGDDDVYKAITANFVPLKFDVTKDNDVNDERKIRYDSTTLPSVVFMSPDGRVLGRVRKFMEPEDVMKILGPAVTKLGAKQSAQAAQASQASGMRRLPWVTGDEAGAFARARNERKGVMVDFSAVWCNPCEELEHTFAADGIYEQITTSFVPLKLDVTDTSPANDALQQRYDSKTLPSVVFMSPDGKVLGRVRKMMEPDELAAILTPAVQQLGAQLTTSSK